MDAPHVRFHIRAARVREADALTALILRSKAHWDYAPALLEAWRADLTLTAAMIASAPTYCAEEAATGTVAGVSHFYPLNDAEVYLDHLFVEPAAIGQGVGALLWRHAIAWATDQGARAVVLGADPHARPFYEHMGATVVGWIDSSVVPGRRNPRMRYDLPPG